MVSILIPTYNYNVLPLVEALSEEVTQLDHGVEILVLDDASDLVISEKETLAKLKNITYTVLTENVGRTAARHQLATKATYEKLLFLDADVLPVYSNFVARYAAWLNEPGIVFGGISYMDERPPATEILRWKYGHAREKRSVEQRNETPYDSLTTGCFLIEKALFLAISETIQLKAYGMDLVLKQKLKEQHIPVKHIDNPVYHLGLEENRVFFNKALEAVKTTIILEEKGWLPNDSRGIQKSYLKLKKWNALSTFSSVFNRVKGKIERNILCDNPNLRWFDLYRLNFYIEHKKKPRA